MKIDVTLANGDKHTVDVQNPDRVKWDRTAHRHNWPKFSEVPFMGMTFWAWAAMTRTGLYTGTWDQFADVDCIDLTGEDLDAAKAELDPTQTAAQPAF